MLSYKNISQIHSIMFDNATLEIQCLQRCLKKKSVLRKISIKHSNLVLFSDCNTTVAKNISDLTCSAEIHTYMLSHIKFNFFQIRKSKQIIEIWNNYTLCFQIFRYHKYVMINRFNTDYQHSRFGWNVSEKPFSVIIIMWELTVDCWLESGRWTHPTAWCCQYRES